MTAAFEAALVAQCAPTLASVKPANLFRFRGGIEQTHREAKRWDRALAPRGVRVRVLKECPATDACMVYVYRESWVARLLAEEENRAFLEKAGYCPGNLSALLDQLSRRLCLEQEYPHEIGVFLGYPLQDVVGFIENRGRNYTCCGYWKAYGNPEAARRCFARYRRCTEIYQQHYTKGIPLIKLVAAA